MPVEKNRETHCQVSTPATIETDEDEVDSSLSVEEECTNELNRPGGMKYSREYLKQKYQTRINLSRRGGHTKVVHQEFKSSAVNTRVTVINQKLAKGRYRLKDKKHNKFRSEDPNKI